MIQAQQHRNHQAINQQGITSGLTRDWINNDKTPSKEEELKNNTRETKLKLKKEDWRPNEHGKEVNLERLRAPQIPPRLCSKP